ncbi:MAG: phosphoribosylamine--glycine ligase [Wenzhouxiangellaceae bacterium]
MKVLIVGGGGREHALAWCAASSPRVSNVWVAPGNAGTALEDKVTNVDISADDIDALLELAQQEAIDLTIVGPEAPLVAGIVDRFQAAGLACFGPQAAAAQLEGSKAYAKAFMQRHGIPTAAYARFDDFDNALEYVNNQSLPIVIKADGLAAGKGVVIATTLAEAELALRAMLCDDTFGSAGAEVVIEDFLAGEEASFIVLASGEDFIEFPTSQDHKRLGEGDTGPNTGGMGAYSPAPVVTPAVRQRIIDQVIRPTLAGLQADGTPYTGFLYAGLMIDVQGNPQVLEFNCRMGDPETQPLLLRLRSDLTELLQQALSGKLASQQAEWDPRCSIGVVLAAGGYPASYAKGLPITGLDSITDDAVKVFHAGTRADAQGQILTSGGRVLAVCALGDDLVAARGRAYAAAGQIRFDDVYLRHDIGHRALAT